MLGLLGLGYFTSRSRGASRAIDFLFDIHFI